MAKDETGNVAGPHKGRHLMAAMVHLLVLERLHEVEAQQERRRPDHCAVRTAAVSHRLVRQRRPRRRRRGRGGHWPLHVFVPPAVDPPVRRRLGELGAEIHLCERRPGEAGDPCYLRYREAVAAGAVPFAVQGPENGVSLDGGATLGYELADQLRRLPGDLPPGRSLRLFVQQVGGGTLASSVMAGLRRAVRLGRLDDVPALVAVQAEGCAPLGAGLPTGRRAGGGAPPARPTGFAGDRHRTGDRDALAIEEVLADAARHRSQMMWAWEQVPTSSAGGILDDETYDWRAVVGAVLHSGGTALTVSEAQIETANRLVRSLAVADADRTGTAGVAGLLALGPCREGATRRGPRRRTYG